MTSLRVTTIALAVLLSGACMPSDVVAPSPRPARAPTLNFVAIGGTQFYEDSASGELIPPAGGPDARIDSPTSRAALSCQVGKCNASFKAEHTGMWHWSSQSLNWFVDELNGTPIANGVVTTSGGVGCTEVILVFCRTKRQANTHQWIGPIQSSVCDVKARLSTDHTAGWSTVFSITDFPPGMRSTHCDSPPRRGLRPGGLDAEEPVHGGADHRRAA